MCSAVQAGEYGHSHHIRSVSVLAGQKWDILHDTTHWTGQVLDQVLCQVFFSGYINRLEGTFSLESRESQKLIE